MAMVFLYIKAITVDVKPVLFYLTVELVEVDSTCIQIQIYSGKKKIVFVSNSFLTENTQGYDH